MRGSPGESITTRACRRARRFRTRMSRVVPTSASPRTSPHQSPTGPNPVLEPEVVAHRNPDQPVAQQVGQHRGASIPQPAQHAAATTCVPSKT